MTLPWTDKDVLLLGHSQMEGLAPFLRQLLRESGAGTVHVYTERGLNAHRLRRQRYRGLRIIPPAIADQLPALLVALSGNGAVTDPSELRANIEWLRAEYPHARIFWLGHTITRTGTGADAQRATAAELEQRVVPSYARVDWIDMRMPTAQLAPDGIHLTRRGYRQLADHAWRQILDATRQRPAARTSPFVAATGGALLGAIAGCLYRRLTSSE